MDNLDINVIKLVRSLLISQGTTVGGRDSSAIKIASAMKEIAETGVHAQVDPILALAVQKTLAEKSPEVEELEKWILYEHDFSGITSYLTEGGSLTHAKLIRNIDMTNSSHYEKCYPEVKELIKLKQDENCDRELIKKAEEAVKSKLPGKRIKYMHWIGSKPSKNEIACLATDSSV